MRQYSTSYWAPVVFGDGVAKQAGKKFSTMGVRKVLTVYDRGVFEAGIVDVILKTLTDEGIEVVHFDKVLADPPDHIVVEGAKLANDEKVDGILGIGGGSSLDAAKVIAVYRHCEPPLSKYYIENGGLMLAQRQAKMILIPTTAGTGAEMTPGGVITDTEKGVKYVCGGPGCYADVVLLDPTLTLSLPPYVTATTGMDALSHSIESMTSTTRNPMSDMLCGQAVEYIWRSLPKAYINGADIEARSELAIAANITLTSGAARHLGHALAHAIGAKFHIAHGHACALALPEVVRFVAKDTQREMKIIAHKMGLDKDDRLGEEIASAIEALNQQLGIKKLRELGFLRRELDDCIAVALGDVRCISAMDSTPTEQDLTKIMDRIYG